MAIMHVSTFAPVLVASNTIVDLSCAVTAGETLLIFTRNENPLPGTPPAHSVADLTNWVSSMPFRSLIVGQNINHRPVNWNQHLKYQSFKFWFEGNDPGWGI